VEDLVERISLPLFVDFALTAGPARAAAVQASKDRRYDHLTDFYKPLREAIVAMHVGGHPDAVLDALVPSLVDERKRRLFPPLIAGYRAFAAASQALRWILPPRAAVSLGELEIDVAPELAFEVAGAPLILATWWPTEPLPQKRVDLVVELLGRALGAAHPGAVFGVLDVAAGRVRSARGAHAPLHDAWLRAEAAAFSTLHAAI
jgi:hypothetical protein